MRKQQRIDALKEEGNGWIEIEIECAYYNEVRSFW
jgi:hypothetical protein